MWKSTHSVKTPIDSRVNSVRQNSLDSIWNNKRESIDFDSSRRMGRINSSIDRLSLTKSGMIPTFSDSKIDKAPTLANSPANKDIDKIIDQSAEIFNSQLEHSFGCETIPRESVKTDKEQDTVLVGLSPGKESIKDDDDEAIPDQIITHIRKFFFIFFIKLAKPITKEAAPVGQWSDKENRKSPFEKRDPKSIFYRMK